MYRIVKKRAESIVSRGWRRINWKYRRQLGQKTSESGARPRSQFFIYFPAESISSIAALKVG